MLQKIHNAVAEYYSEKVIKHGCTASGVDWNSKESQYLRFEQLCKVIDRNSPFSIIDYGCGYAELVNFLRFWAKDFHFKYLGFDISAEMIKNAKALFGKFGDVTLMNKAPVKPVDYVLSSGIFNVKLNLVEDTEWLDYIFQTLVSMNALAKKGFSFNALTIYSDKEHMKDYLYYADPLKLFDYCKNNFSKNVALFHDYELYEFTIIVRK